MTVITFVQFDGSERMVDGDVGLSLMETALKHDIPGICLLYTSPSPRDRQKSRMPSSA